MTIITATTTATTDAASVDAPRAPFACVSTTATEMRRALSVIAKVTGRRDDATATFAVSDSVATLAGADMDVHVRLPLAATTAGAGTINVGVKALSASLKGAKGPVALAIGDSLAVSHGPANLTVPAVDYAAAWPTAETTPTASASFGELSAAIALTLPAAATDATRLILTGVLLTTDGDDGPSLVATDAYRLHVTTVRGLTGNITATIPRVALLTLASVKAPAGAPVALSVDESGRSCRIDVAGAEIVTRLLDGQFPNYRQLLREEFTTATTVDAAAITGALESVGAVAKASKRVTLAWSRESVNVSAASGGVTFANATVVGASDITPDEPMGFNPDYLADATRGLSGPVVLRTINNPSRPLIVTADGFRGLVMPLRLDV